jgi:hypothetical protein
MNMNLIIRAKIIMLKIIMAKPTIAKLIIVLNQLWVFFIMVKFIKVK